jgi:carbonic anhydrase
MSIRFDERHPRALAIYCSDGRFTDAVELLLRSIGHERLDTMTLPGGPALLCPAGANLAEVDTVTRAAQFLIEGHAIAEVVLVAHQGCGYYRHRHTHLAPPRIETLQLEHLAAAATALLRRHPRLAIRRYFARVDSGEISFEDHSTQRR